MNVYTCTFLPCFYA